MLKENRLQFVVFFLILVDSWLILDRLFPQFHAVTLKYTQLSSVLILIGGVILLFGFLLGESNMFVPSMVILGVGEIVTYQESHGGFAADWFRWALLSIFIGAGMALSGIFDEESAPNIKQGVMLIVIGGVLFAILAAIFTR